MQGIQEFDLEGTRVKLSFLLCCLTRLRFDWFGLSRHLFHSFFLDSPRMDLASFGFPGLRYEDLLNNSHPEVAEAIELADPDVVTGRLRRLKRASDLSFKGKNLGDYAPNAPLDPFKFELWNDVQKLKARNEEYAALDLYKK